MPTPEELRIVDTLESEYTVRSVVAYSTDRKYEGHISADLYPNQEMVITDSVVLVEGQGLGPRLMRQLVCSVGQGVSVWSAIDHENSDRMLETSGWYDAALHNPEVTITDRQYLVGLPIVRIYERGGVAVTHIGFIQGTDELYAVLYGQTTDPALFSDDGNMV